MSTENSQRCDRRVCPSRGVGDGPTDARGISSSRRHAKARPIAQGLSGQMTWPAIFTVLNGEDNDLESSIRQYEVGDSLYLHSRGDARFSVGPQFSLIRPAKELFRTTRYSGEHRALRKLGKPFEDTGRVQVTQLRTQGAVAAVKFACRPIIPVTSLCRTNPELSPNMCPGSWTGSPWPTAKCRASSWRPATTSHRSRAGPSSILTFKQGMAQRPVVLSGLLPPTTSGTLDDYRSSPHAPRNCSGSCGPLRSGKVYRRDHCELQAQRLHRLRRRTGITTAPFGP